MKIVFIITGLSVGGAEMMLYKLLSQINKELFQLSVISLTDIGPVGEQIKKLSIPVYRLNMKRNFVNPFLIFTLACMLKKLNPDLIQTSMYHADFIGGLAARLIGKTPVIWGIHHSNLNIRINKLSTILIAMICARLSRNIPYRIICCSEASKKVHQKMGYDSEKLVVIPNGFDIELFKPDQELRLTFRKELGISENSILIGMAGRFDPEKDIQCFIDAASILSEKYPDVRFILCGRRMDWDNPDLLEWIENKKLKKVFYLLGVQDNMPRFWTSLDIASLTSISEAFPNVLGEAMACAVPCVATNVGDSALIIQNYGRVVPPRSPEKLAEAWAELLEKGPAERKRLGLAARERIVSNYNIKKICECYAQLYSEVIKCVG